ncbi:putative protein OS=Tsukamurella paurometabola (strain ATCC 8368 / DSM / CCUG 35730 /CIP 100753 / JCM 10117 / KCTC 9821 / NBRC 16120 / NCIMB 702349/ NCTC 13040) OX=521096 GN=Tpau_3075 PE=4 SV=1 [Tsukamurella paurometabola]|uniref:Uncharacterized protein n=1 Tax=Tsukamurella paurometabola (strain ATCC 8368 / DSM 20162 / CCUG 35730 / CIP 100753 / JCM 10117 / KCTC 9821 / NBRC 16120 / NCIMB 702349 / NCTC 13040) TaxID=521096 RepID=D5UUU9_TSUPD|nr:hypothetical protein [Tsukamurella paurometabola]ADG79667.1 hypothetical protein Tpau_3075 [Tsukamurella paurometabola DSM 20162]SUP36679.1 Uncharacterised protein [Tsukamurella paurometabola]
MSEFRHHHNLAIDPMTASVYARLADLHDEASRPAGAPRPAGLAAAVRSVLTRFVASQPEYTGPAYLRA